MKHPVIEAALEGFAIATFGRSRAVCRANQECIKCGTKDLKLDTLIKQDEYKLSVLCGTCQDEIFTEGKDDGAV